MDQRVITVVILMKEDLQKKITLNELAYDVNLSLTHLFKADTSLSIAEHLKNIRMEKAKELQNHVLSVTEIMAKVCISDRSQFAKDFKEI